MKTCPHCLEKHDKNGRFCSRICGNRYAIENMPMKNCAIRACAKEFKPKSKSAKYCSDKHDKICSDCENGFSVISRNWETRELCNKCSRLAAAKKGSETIEKRYGVDNAMKMDSTKEKARATTKAKHGVEHYTQTDEYKEKVKASNLENYGVEHTFQRKDVKSKIEESLEHKYGGHHLKTEEVKARQRATNIERYGVENVAQSEEIKDKIKATNLEKHGATSSLHGPHVSEKVRQTWLEKYGVSHPMQNEEFYNNWRAAFRAKYGVDVPAQHKPFYEKMVATRKENGSTFNSGKISKLNRTIANEIQESLNVNVMLEKEVGGLYYDLWIEDSKILIEINPTISHNVSIGFKCVMSRCELPCEIHANNINTQSHFKKARTAQDNGYSLIQFYDWDSKESVIDFLRGKLERNWKKHSARKLTVKTLKQSVANKFLEKSHIQGGAKEQTYCYGLYSEDELLAVATFGKARFKAKADFEWIRYAVKKGHIVHGGPNRMLKAFAADLAQSTDGYNVVSYVDYNHTTAEKTFLHSIGFDELKPTGPQLIWSKKDKRIYNNSLIALGADRLLGISYGSVAESGLKNEDIMLLEGWLPVYTAGNRVFKKRLKDFKSAKE